MDLLRALAILFVMFEHGNILLPVYMTDIIDWFIFDGVSIFFVLSGFLIGKILIREFINKPVSTSTVFKFLNRRWWRTLPNYFLVLLLLIFLQVFILNKHSNTNIWEYLIFIQNMFTPHPEFFPEAWSLSIEEWFYFSIPLLFLLFTVLFSFIKKKNLITKNQLYVIALLMSILLVHFLRYDKYVSAENWDYSSWDLNFRKMIFVRFDSILIGLLSAWISLNNVRLWNNHKKLFFVIGLIILLVYQVYWKSSLNNYNHLFTCVFSFSIFSIGTALLLPFLSNYTYRNKSSLYRIITVTSLVSYSMYLINLSLIQSTVLAYLPIHRLFENEFLLSIIRYILFFLITILLSILQYKYFENPLTKMRDKKIFKNQDQPE